MSRIFTRFTEKELKCRCGNCDLGQKQMDHQFMIMATDLRNRVGVMPVSSAVRCLLHNAKVSKFKSHTLKANPDGLCHTLDFLTSGKLVPLFISTAIELGFTGIGIHQRGPHNQRFLHIDNLPRPYPVTWTY